MREIEERYYKAMIKAFLKGYFACLREVIGHPKIGYGETEVTNNCRFNEIETDLKQAKPKATL